MELDLYKKIVAKVCHNVNKAYCEGIGDFSQPSWEEAPEWQKESAVDGVTFHLDNPAAKPSDSHDNWMELKISEGWIFGEEKNAEKKTHPCIIPYDELPNEQKIKDLLFIVVVHSLSSNQPIDKSRFVP